MSSRRAASPARASGAGTLSGNGSATKVGAALKARPPANVGKNGTAAASLSLPAARKTGSSSPATTPSTSDRLQLRGTSASYTQKPKPSALAARNAGLRADPDALSPQNSPTSSASGEAGSRRTAGRSRLAPKGAAEAEGQAEQTEAPLSIDVGAGAAADGGDDEPFVPEEEEEGPSTQGDHLMMAKAKMRRQRGVGSPGIDSPGSPVRRAHAPAAACTRPTRAPQPQRSAHSLDPARALRVFSRGAAVCDDARHVGQHDADVE